MTTKKIDFSKIDTLCVSGGGNKCFTFLGALDYLTETNKIKIEQFTKYSATSGGALISYFLVLGYTIEQTKEFVQTLDIFKLVDKDFNLDYLLTNYGLNNGNKFMYTIKQLLKNMFNVEDITLLELYNLTKKEFIIIGTNFTNGIETAFSYKTHPNMSVITALRITISIPYMFTPVLYEGDYYVDGGITNNFPINWCNQETTLGIYVKGTVKNNINNIIDIYSGCFCIMFDASVDMVVKDFNNIITIVNTEEMNEKGFSNFDLTDDYKKYLLDLGYSCAKIWYDEYNNLNEL